MLGSSWGLSMGSDRLWEDGVRGNEGAEPKGTRLPRGLDPPHAEVQCQVHVSGHLQDVVWGQPHLGLGIKEGEEIEAGGSDAWDRGETRSGARICRPLPGGPPPGPSPPRASPCTSRATQHVDRAVASRTIFPPSWFLNNRMLPEGYTGSQAWK